MIKLPRYTKRDTRILLAFLVPFALILNYLLFDNLYFTDIGVFVAATLVTFFIQTLSWLMHTWVATTVRNRFIRDRDMIKRMAISLFLFIIMTGITLTLIFYGYGYVNFMGYELDESKYNWALTIGVIVNIFATVVHESVSGFEKWKLTLTETEQLKKEYMQSQLFGLRSQVSPHFLFNCLNSLSSLISESPAQAEQFLDEMSKVYRYLLRSSDEQIVELGTELQFVHSYFHLLKARYGTGVDLVVDIKDSDRGKLLPHLTLQILLDNILKLNLISKDRPLSIHISINAFGWLEVKNNIQNRITGDVVPDEKAISGISNKFRLLCHHSLEIDDNGKDRIIKIPLLLNEQMHAI